MYDRKIEKLTYEARLAGVTAAHRKMIRDAELSQAGVLPAPVMKDLDETKSKQS